MVHVSSGRNNKNNNGFKQVRRLLCWTDPTASIAEQTASTASTTRTDDTTASTTPTVSPPRPMATTASPSKRFALRTSLLSVGGNAGGAEESLIRQYEGSFPQTCGVVHRTFFAEIWQPDYNFNHDWLVALVVELDNPALHFERLVRFLFQSGQSSRRYVNVVTDLYVVDDWQLGIVCKILEEQKQLGRVTAAGALVTAADPVILSLPLPKISRLGEYTQIKKRTSPSSVVVA